MPSKSTCRFKVGDIVRHKSSFLRSVGWYTDVPMNGLVMEVQEGLGPSTDPGLLRVKWCDFLGDKPLGILAANVELYPGR